MRRPEQRFYDWLCASQILPGDFNRVENSVCEGMPDLELCYQGKQAWIELKVQTLKTFEPSKLLTSLVDNLLRESQRVWHLRRVCNQGKVLVLVGHLDMVGVYKVIKHADRYQRYILEGMFSKKTDLVGLRRTLEKIVTA
jgi:hypothetical protein